ncbi:MAG TPA: Type 1 glutamine amidotransferase-like domain-containing protein [Acidimicrobiales bacterium]|nr:Type 1 glutamine amidotransferase-like domain-containing protein [Acidimicrobiales bacterium]
MSVGSTGSVGGLLALVGGAEWQPGCDFDAELLERSGGTDVVVLPTAAAYEHPERAVATAQSWFAALGGKATGLMVLSHADACREENADVVRGAGFVYLSGGSPLHLRSVLKGSAVLDAIGEAWRRGAVVAGSSAGAMVLCDPMVDPRGGAFTVGLGLVEQMAVVPHHDSGAGQHLWRILELAPSGVPVAGIAERTALIREPDGSWRSTGQGAVTVYLDGRAGSLADLPA